MDGVIERLAVGTLSVDGELERTFEAALLECSTLAFRVAFSVLRHQQDAEDVAQEALVKAHQRLRQLRDRDRLRAWLVRLTWRLAIDRRRGDLRRSAREAAHAREQPQAVVSKEFGREELLARERADALWRAIDALPEKLRVVIVLANMQGHDLEQVGRLLELPIGTVKSRLFQARVRLKEQLSCAGETTNRQPR